MSVLKLISLNIERSKHLDLVLPFLERERADVVCLQELMEYDVGTLERAVAGPCVFAPMERHSAEGRPGILGVGILTALPVEGSAVMPYSGPDTLMEYDETSVATRDKTERCMLAACNVVKEGTHFRVAATHFTWTPDGRPDEFQRANIGSLLAALDGLDEFVLCGDFNAPREIDGKPGEIFSALSAKYKDSIPPEYKTSIDITLHRVGRQRPHELVDKMVDGLFTTPGYVARDVRLQPGVSDHMAIVASVGKRP